MKDKYHPVTSHEEVRGGPVGWATVLQAGRSRFRFPMVSLDFSLTQSFRPHYGPGVDLASNRNKYQEHFCTYVYVDTAL
jgi:hypothetical protein